MRHLLVLLALWPCVTGVGQEAPLARPGPIRFSHQHAENLNMTFAILQDHEGFMWFGQGGGGGGRMYRYDGQTYVQFEHDPSDSSSPSGGSVLVLYEDRDSVLWVGKGRGLNRFDRESETFRRYLHDPEDPNSISAGEVKAILEDGQNRFWVGTDGGLNLMDRETGTFARYLPDSVNSGISALLEARDGTIWAGSWGLCRFDPSTGTFTRYLPYPVIPEPLENDRYASANWVTSLHEDLRGELWIGTASGGIYRLAPGSGTFVNFRHDPSRPIPYADDIIQTVADDPDGGLWVATWREGLLWLDPGSSPGPSPGPGRKTGVVTAFQHDPLDRHSLSGNSVLSLYRDRQDVFWVGTYWRDVDRFDRAARPFQYFYAVPGQANSWPFAHVYRITHGKDGTVWVLTEDDTGSLVLSSLERETGTYTTYWHSPSDPRSPNANQDALYTDHAGIVWIGGPSLGRMDPGRPGRITHFRHDPADPASLGPGSVRWIFEDSKNRLWAGTQNYGLSRVDDRERGRFTRFPLGNGIGWINNIHEDAAGFLWIGSGGGLYRLDPETGAAERFVHDPNDPNSLAQRMVFGVWERPQEPGVLWLGLFPVGLGRFDPDHGTFRLYTVADGLPDNGAQGVLGDEDGNLWISTDHGLSRFDPDTGTFTNFDVDDGLQGASFTGYSYHKSRWTGELFFGGPNGLNAFFPRLLRDNPYPPQIALTSLNVGGRLVRPGPESPLERRLQALHALTLTHRQNDLAIDFVALHFRHPEKNRYTYILEGYDEVWSDTTSTIRRASYTNLPPGDYVFRVSASNSDGVWTPEPRSLRITILPPWWRTWWAYGIYLLFAVGGVFQGYRWQHARLVAREREAARERELAQAREIERQHVELTRTHAELESAHETLKTTQAQLVQSEKLASLGQLTAGIAHEIQNPLNFVNNFAELNEEVADELKETIRKNRGGSLEAHADEIEDLAGSVKTNAGQIAKHGKRAEAIVKSMMAHATAGSGERLMVVVNDFVAEYVRIAGGAFATRRPDIDVKIEEDYDPATGTVRMAPQELGRAVVNILSNAFDAVRNRAESGDDGYIPSVTVSTHRTADAIEIRITDNGPGIPDDIVPRIFEPFFTTKPTGEGTGLGLSLAHDIVVQGHGGKLEVKSGEGNGVTFVVALPAGVDS